MFIVLLKLSFSIKNNDNTLMLKTGVIKDLPFSSSIISRLVSSETNTNIYAYIYSLNTIMHMTNMISTVQTYLSNSIRTGLCVFLNSVSDVVLQ